jgi:hypothetical protein
MERNFQSTGFSQHWKSRFSIGKLKSWFNKRACVRVFFETHYEKSVGGLSEATQHSWQNRSAANLQAFHHYVFSME